MLLQFGDLLVHRGGEFSPAGRCCGSRHDRPPFCLRGPMLCDPRASPPAISAMAVVTATARSAAAAGCPCLYRYAAPVSRAAGVQQPLRALPVAGAASCIRARYWPLLRGWISAHREGTAMGRKLPREQLDAGRPISGITAPAAVKVRRCCGARWQQVVARLQATRTAACAAGDPPA